MSTYLKFLSKNKLYTVIEALGLSVALGFVILLTSYARTEFSVGARQPRAKQIYAIGGGDCVGMTLCTGDEFFPSMPEIASWTRIGDLGDKDVTVGEDYYPAVACAIDTNFLKLFDYGLDGCDRNHILANTDEVILSEKYARKVFGSEDPVGKTLTIAGDKLTVVGTMEDFGAFDEFCYYDIFLSAKKLAEVNAPMDNFGNVQTFVTLADGVSPDAVREKLLDKYMGYWKEFYTRNGDDGGFLWGSSLTRLDKLYFSELESYRPLRKGDKRTVEVLLLVAMILLVSAIFNYINLTVAQTGKRAKEMATRRLLGESSAGIVTRYLTESFLFTAVCMAIGVLVAFAFKGWFDRILSTEIVIASDMGTIIGALAVLVIVSLISGLLPALMVSRFQPISVVKGDFRFRSKMLFSKVFIVCQNVISMVLVALALTMTLQMKHLVNLPTGYNTDLLAVDSWSLGYSCSRDAQKSLHQILHQRLEELPQVEAVAQVGQLPLKCGNNGVHIDGEKMSWMQMCFMDTTAFRLLGFKVLERYSEPVNGDTWLTEEAKRRYGVTPENPYVGKHEDGTYQYKCCGIIDNFRARDPLFKPEEDSHRAVQIRTDFVTVQLLKVIGDRQAAKEAVRNVWNEVSKEYLGVPRETQIYYLDDFLNDSLTGTRNTMKLVMTFMVLAILISALGLFAMSVYYTEQQSRQIALRKIFGSGVKAAAWKLSKSFILMTAVAVVIAIPVCIWSMRYYLADFYNAIAFPWWVIIVAAALTFLISFASIISRTWSSAAENPVEVLKQEN